jgi:DNA-binding transcriptional ArsR family regulator
MRRDVFQAIADPTRREIIQLISQAPLNLNAVAAHFNISRPAISQHIKILAECGLVQMESTGRERYCVARLEKIGEVYSWAEQYKAFWNKKLDALAQFLDDESALAEKPKNRDHRKSTKRRKK